MRRRRGNKITRIKGKLAFDWQRLVTLFDHQEKHFLFFSHPFFLFRMCSWIDRGQEGTSESLSGAQLSSASAGQTTMARRAVHLSEKGGTKTLHHSDELHYLMNQTSLQPEEHHFKYAFLFSFLLLCLHILNCSFLKSSDCSPNCNCSLFIAALMEINGLLGIMGCYTAL